MWRERYPTVCRKHPDLIAVYESPRGRVALLLRQTMMPLVEERTAWLADTRAVARRVIADLRAAGLRSRVLVLQWLALDHAADVMNAWTCRYEGDRARLAVLTRLVDQVLADRRFLASRAAARPPQPGDGDSLALLAVFGDSRQALKHWYRAMAPSWLAVEPPLRRRLVLRTHRWISERVLGPGGADGPAALADLGPDGALVRALTEIVPPLERDRWQPWVRLLVMDLERALARPAAEQTEAWARWLFLIPYGVPRPAGLSRRPPALGSRGAARVAERRAGPGPRIVAIAGGAGDARQEEHP